MTLRPELETARTLHLVQSDGEPAAALPVDFQLIVEQSFNLVVVTDGSGRVQYVNPRFCEVTGYVADEVVGTQIHELGELSAEQSAEIWATVSSGRTWRGEFPAPKKNGEMSWMQSAISPVLAPDGVVTHFVATNVDITDWKRAEEELRESEERYRWLYQDNPSMYFTVAEDGTVLSVNQFGAEQLGYTSDELVGASVYEVFHKADRAAVRRQFDFLAKDRSQVRSWEFRKVRKDGEVIWVREIVRASQDAAGQTIFLVVCEDISEGRRMEETMQSMREELERRAERAVAHGSRYALSFREMTVVELVASGNSDKEIGVILGIRPMTVSKHVANVLKKMGAASRAEAGVRALREGIIN